MPAWVSEGSVRKYVRAEELLRKENVMRRAAGQPEVPVTEAALKALYIKFGGLVLEVPEPKEEKQEPEGLEAMTVKALKELAEEKAVDLGDATLKADIIAKLKEAGIE